MNAHTKKADANLSGVNPEEVPCSLPEFCEFRRLSLRSRLELLEYVCALVAAAHANGAGFTSIRAEELRVYYLSGSLSIEMPPAVALSRSSSDTNPLRAGRFTSGQLLQAANVVQLGRLLHALIAPLGIPNFSIESIIARATTLDSSARMSADELRIALAAARAALPATASNQADGEVAASDPRWSWS